jgi:aminoglycoside phosphotransferase (APT) family kinase protein
MEHALWLREQLGLETIAWRKLIGSTSSSLFSVNETFVLRVLDNLEWLSEEPDLAAHEAAALAEAQRTNVPSPKPIGFSSDQNLVLMTLLPGKTELLPPRLPQLAQTLAQIHRHDATHFAWTYRTWVDHKSLSVPAWAEHPALWETAITRWNQPPPDSPFVFLHRDFHPGNVLWEDEAITGVVDWINACLGPAGVDVGHCRMNLALMHGPEVAAEFLAAYQRSAPEFVYEPYWDIDTIFDACLPGPSFYPPWAEFGIETLSEATLQRRVEKYLQQILLA